MRAMIELFMMVAQSARTVIVQYEKLPVLLLGFDLLAHPQ